MQGWGPGTAVPMEAFPVGASSAARPYGISQSRTYRFPEHHTLQTTPAHTVIPHIHATASVRAWYPPLPCPPTQHCIWEMNHLVVHFQSEVIKKVPGGWGMGPRWTLIGF